MKWQPSVEMPFLQKDFPGHPFPRLGGPCVNPLLGNSIHFSCLSHCLPLLDPVQEERDLDSCSHQDGYWHNVALNDMG
jgi:hypothetical protein